MSENRDSQGKESNLTGLVVEGGGLRGIYAAGVLDVMIERGLTYDGIVGVSAGAVHATSFMANQPGRGVRFYLTFSKDPHFMGLRSWLSTGNFINEKFCYEDLPSRLAPLDYDSYEASAQKTSFYITCSDVESGKPYYHLSKSLRGKEMDALRASASLPVISKMVEFEGHKLLDGGALDSIPVEFLRQQGYRRTVVVLTQMAGYVKKPEKMTLVKLMYKRYPEFVHAMETRHERYNATLRQVEELEKTGEIFVFRPSRKVNIKRLERNAATILEMYELGRHDANERLADLKAFLNPEG
ncbi:MAG: patatin family protein [Proteobacteria bacterium]|nr:patatin family protein [Pseudomonadota bacterium]